MNGGGGGGGGGTRSREELTRSLVGSRPRWEDSPSPENLSDGAK